MSKVLLLGEDQVRSLISMKDVIDACEKTFLGMGTERVVNPTKVTLDLGIGGKWPGFNASMNAMPAYIGWQKIPAGQEDPRLRELLACRLAWEALLARAVAPQP